jgi:hypothetical protein
VQSEQTNDLSTALAKAQSSMQAAKFDKTNPHFKNKYASLAAVIDAIRKPLAENGLSYTQATEIRDGGLILVTTLRHASGQWVASEYPLPNAAKPQDLGSALTYARRYCLSAIACIAADEDDDAEGAREGGQVASTPRAKASPIKPAQIEPPVNPETGEVSPHTITAPDAMTWGSLFVAAVSVAQNDHEIDQWLDDNDAGLGTLEGAAPKIYQRVMTRVSERREDFKKKAA